MKRFTLLILAIWSGMTLSQQVQDPTKPKLVFVAPQPTAVAEGIEEQNSFLRLQSIVTKKGNKLAIISGELYNKGDKVKGYQIREIHNSYVVIAASGTQKRLYVYE